MGVTTRQATMAVCLLLAVWAVSAAAQGTIPTPVAEEFNISPENGSVAGPWGWVLDLGNTGQRIGLAMACTRDEDVMIAALFFGPYPADKPVQVAVNSADGSTWHAGHPETTQHGAASGYHSPILTGDSAREFMNHALQNNSLISNGHNSFWNRIPVDRNTQVRNLLLECQP